MTCPESAVIGWSGNDVRRVECRPELGVHLVTCEHYRLPEGTPEWHRDFVAALGDVTE